MFSNFSGTLRENWGRCVCETVNSVSGGGIGVAIHPHRELSERATHGEGGKESKEKLSASTSVSHQRNLPRIMTADSLLPSKHCTDLQF